MADKFHCLNCGVEFDQPEATQANYRCPDCGAELATEQATENGKQSGLAKTFSALLVLSCLVVAGYFLWQSADKTNGPAIAKIQQQALEVNSKTPMMIDNSTRLDQIVVEDETIIYKTTLVNFTAETADHDIFKEKIGPFLADKYCSDKKSRAALELGVKYGHEYFGNNGVLLYTAKISLDDCLKRK
jgi:hypothetical protein